MRTIRTKFNFFLILNNLFRLEMNCKRYNFDVFLSKVTRPMSLNDTQTIHLYIWIIFTSFPSIISRACSVQAIAKNSLLSNISVKKIYLPPLNKWMNEWISKHVVYTSCGKRWKMFVDSVVHRDEYDRGRVCVRKSMHTHQIILRKGISLSIYKPISKYYTVYFNLYACSENYQEKTNFLKNYFDWLNHRGFFN